MTARPSKVSMLTDEAFADLVRQAKSYADICVLAGVTKGGTNQIGIKNRILRLGLSIDHFTGNRRRLEAAPPKRRNRRWLRDLTDAEFIEIASQVTSYEQMARALGAGKSTGKSFTRGIKSRAALLGMDLSHFIYQPTRGENKGSNRRTTQSLLTNRNPPMYSMAKLLSRMVADGIVEEKCQHCGTGSDWHGKKMQLTLHRKNDDLKDRRLENLEVVCWNCRSILMEEAYVRRGILGAKARRQNLERQKHLRLLEE